MNYKGFNLVLAIIWSINLIIYMILFIMGKEPTWIAIFCPTVYLVVQFWVCFYFSCKGEDKK